MQSMRPSGRDPCPKVPRGPPSALGVTPMHAEAAELQQAERALGWEWLESNGLGGYAASTVAFANTLPTWQGWTILTPVTITP